MWKERLWQMFLVVILGLVLSMCSRSVGNNNTSSSSNANADETHTLSVSSMPLLKLESLHSMTITMDNSSSTPVAVTSFPTVTVDNSSTFTVTLANAGTSAISQTMFCYGDNVYRSGVITYSECDASDDTVLISGTITHDVGFSAGWKLVGSGCSYGGNSQKCALFHK